jgi:hypothetical protein
MNQIVKLDPKEYGLTETKAKEVAAMFQPMLDKMVELENEYNALTQSIEGEPSEDDCKKAKELRLQYVKIRTGTAAIHKELKAFYLAGGRFVDGWKNAQLMASQGIEEKLKEIETHQERKEAERKAALEAERKDELGQYTSDIPSGLGDMPDNVWEMYLAGAKKSHADRLEAERKAEEERKRLEAERIAREKAEAEERERIHKENERLKAEVAERKLKAAEERRKREAEEQARRKAEALRIKKEQEERERVEREYQAKIEAERQEKLKIQKQAEAKRKAEEEAKRKAAEEAEAARQAELAKGDDQIMEDLRDDIVDLIGKYTGRFKSETYKSRFNIVAKYLEFAREKAQSEQKEAA